MSTLSLKIKNETGLHARPATLLAKTAQEYSCDIVVHHAGKSANAKSLISILALGVSCGEEISVDAEGAQAEDALKAIRELVESDFEVAKFTVSD